MSYYPKKGMYRDANGVHRFVDPGQEPVGAAGKRWFVCEVTRLHLDGKGKTLRRDVQRTTVYALPAEATGLACRRCPDPWTGEDVGRAKTYVEVRPLFSEEKIC